MNYTVLDTLNILIVEDNPADLRLIQEILLESNASSRSKSLFEFVHAGTLKKALHILTEMTFDLILLDLTLPDSQGFNTFSTLHDTVTEIPIVILSGLANETLAVEAVKQGAQDYLLKNDMFHDGVLLRSLRYALERHRLWLALEQKTLQLKKSEANRRAIIERNPDGIIIIDQQGFVKFVNPAAEDILRNDRNNMLDRPFKLTNLVNGRTELKVERRRGGIASIEVQLVETEWEGEPVFQASIRDITNHKELQHQIIKKADALAEQNMALDEFAHTVAHQIQGLLSQIIGYASFIESSKDETLSLTTQQSIHRIIRSGNKINNIINELLLLASMDSKEVPLIPLNLGRIVREIRKRLRFQISAANATIVVQEEWPIPVGHEAWIEEALLNYITNGIKYGGEPPFIEVGAALNSYGMVRIWVRDNGEGISEMDQRRLFKPHTRLQKSRAKGEGLGLSIVKRIIHRCGGSVGVESELGRGSTFWFTLPQTTPAEFGLAYESPPQLETQLSAD